MIIIGSTALKHFGLNRQEPKDLDIFISIGDKIPEEKCDYHIISKDLYAMFKYVESNGLHYVIPDHIYTLKCSHFAWNQHWEKTLQDILWLNHKGCKIVPELYTKLKQFWETVHGSKDFLCLDKTKKDFFTDGVKYKYDHDWLHELVAYPNPPVYTKCLRPGADVMISKKSFDKLTNDDKIRMFREEITVIAIERWLVQDGNKLSWLRAYQYALKKTITNLTKNWANDFLIMNLKEFCKPDYQYFKHALATLELI
jgi:hypothetical protein